MYVHVYVFSFGNVLINLLNVDMLVHHAPLSLPSKLSSTVVSYVRTIAYLVTLIGQ